MDLKRANLTIARLERNREVTGFLTKFEEAKLENAYKAKASFENQVTGEAIMEARA